MKSIKSNLILFLTLVAIAGNTLKAQEAQNNIPIEFSIGGAYTIAPTINITGFWSGETEASANFYSAMADLTINNALTGRVVVSSLIPSSVSGSDREVESGFEMSGSMGYRLSFENNNKVTIPVMATLGYASFKDTSGRREVGMQVGGTAGINYSITEKFSLTGTVRYLKGVGFNDGSKVDQVDMSIGFMVRLF